MSFSELCSTLTLLVGFGIVSLRGLRYLLLSVVAIGGLLGLLSGCRGPDEPDPLRADLSGEIAAVIADAQIAFAAERAEARSKAEKQAGGPRRDARSPGGNPERDASAGVLPVRAAPGR